MTNFKDVNPLSDFNWEEFENGGTVSGDKNELTKSTTTSLNKIQEHQVVEGVVTSIDKKKYSEHRLQKRWHYTSIRIRYNPELKVGDKVEVYVETKKTKVDNLFFHTKSTPAKELGEHKQGSRRRCCYSRLHQESHQRWYDC